MESSLKIFYKQEDNELFKDFLNDYNILQENVHQELFEPFKLEYLELVMIQKLKNFNNFFIFKNLKELNIIAIDLDTTGIENLSKSLQILRLVNCNIKEITKNFTKLNNLEILSLGENSINSM